MPTKLLRLNRTVLLILTLQFSCSYAIRNSDLLENDTKFIYQSSQKKTLQQIKKKKQLHLYTKNNKIVSPDIINDIALSEIHFFNLNKAEKDLKTLSTKHNNPVYLANLTRIYYLSD